MLKVGIVGWRGMVGSVLVQRMREERDFDFIEPVFFSTSQAGGQGPSIGKDVGAVQDAMDLDALRALPVVISCQGGDYTSAMHPRLRAAGWRGYWIDAASTLRMDDAAVIVRNPVNIVKSTHYSKSPCINTSFKRRKINFIHGTFRDVSVLVITSS